MIVYTYLMENFGLKKSDISSLFQSLTVQFFCTGNVYLFVLIKAKSQTLRIRSRFCCSHFWKADSMNCWLFSSWLLVLFKAYHRCLLNWNWLSIFSFCFTYFIWALPVQAGLAVTYTQYGPIMNNSVRTCGDAAIRYRTILRVVQNWQIVYTHLF